MPQVGFASPQISGRGQITHPDATPLSDQSQVGQLVEYANHIGIVVLIDQNQVKINTEFLSKCDGKCHCQCNNTKIYDSIEVGKQIVID
jgi:hypothetical protein